MDVVTFILTVVGLILLGIVGYFVTNAAIEVKKIPEYDAVNELQTAHSYLVWASVLGWTTVGLSIIILILHYLGIFFTNPWWVRIILIIALTLSLISGILAALAAYNINKYSGDNQGSYQSSVISSVLGISGFVIFTAALIFSFYWKNKHRVAESAIQDNSKDTSTTSKNESTTNKPSKKVVKEKSKVENIVATQPAEEAVENIGKELGIKETPDVEGYQAAVYNILKSNSKLNLSNEQAEKLAAASPVIAGKLKELSPEMITLIKTNSPELYNKLSKAGPSVVESIKSLSPWVAESFEQYGPKAAGKVSAWTKKYGPQTAEFFSTLL